MEKAKTEQIVLAEYSCYDIDGSLDSIIRPVVSFYLPGGPPRH